MKFSATLHSLRLKAVSIAVAKSIFDQQISSVHLVIDLHGLLTII